MWTDLLLFSSASIHLYSQRPGNFARRLDVLVHPLLSEGDYLYVGQIPAWRALMGSTDLEDHLLALVLLRFLLYRMLQLRDLSLGEPVRLLDSECGTGKHGVRLGESEKRKIRQRGALSRVMDPTRSGRSFSHTARGPCMTPEM